MINKPYFYCALIVLFFNMFVFPWMFYGIGMDTRERDFVQMTYMMLSALFCVIAAWPVLFQKR